MTSKLFAAAFTVAALGTLSAVSVEAQVKTQVFAGVGVTAPRGDGAPSTAVAGGFALLVPMGSGFMVRPMVSVARVNPTAEGKKAFPSVMGAALVMRRITPSFTVLAGGGVTFTYPAGKPVGHLPTLLLSTGSKIGGHWSLLTPVSLNEKGVGFGLQLAVTR